MPVTKTENEVEITPLSESSDLSPTEKETMDRAKKRLKSMENRGIRMIQCPQCGTIHKDINLCGLISCNSLYQLPTGEWRRCTWTRPKTEDEVHYQEVLLQRQIKRAIEGRSKKYDLFY